MPQTECVGLLPIKSTVHLRYVYYIVKHLPWSVMHYYAVQTICLTPSATAPTLLLSLATAVGQAFDKT